MFNMNSSPPAGCKSFIHQTLLFVADGKLSTNLKTKKGKIRHLGE